MIRPEFSHRSLHGAPVGRRRLLIATLIVVGICIADFASHGSIRGIVRGGALYVFTLSERMRAGIIDSGYFRSNHALAQENARLKTELATAKAESASYESLRKENDLLRSLLNLGKSEAGVTAAVISSFRASPYGTFIIAAGARDGVAQGDVVIAEGGFAVGKITDVSETSSIVVSALASGNNIDVIVADAAVVANGEGGANGRLSLPRGVTVLAGDAVIAPSYGSRPIATVGKVEQLPASGEQRVFISLPFNLSLVRFVRVVTAHE